MVGKLTEMEKGLLSELNEVDAILAQALGYEYDKEYGWVVGDHTTVTLAMEAYRKLTGKGYYDGEHSPEPVGRQDEPGEPLPF